MRVQAIIVSKGEAKMGEVEVGKPSRSEVLVETKACGICMGEVYSFTGKLSGGHAMGHEGVGIVAEVGEEVKNVKPEDKVTTLGGPALAAFYKTACQNVAKIPDDVHDLTSWISEPAACAVNGIRGMHACKREKD
jgi:D-arabinose 1-dehydrogenase-like Zn-dependent alcohol dehydrogenase